MKRETGEMAFCLQGSTSLQINIVFRFSSRLIFYSFLIYSIVWFVALLVSHLNGKHDERHEDHNDHQKLRGPDLWGDVSKAHRGEGDHAEVERVEQGQVVACSFQVLDAADADGGRRRRKDGEKGR